MDNSTDACYVADPGDPDVAGLGVTIAFLTSISLAGVAIILLYLRRGLSSALYNNIDKAIVQRLHRTGPVDPKNDPLNRALRNFLFALSDQQLAAGVSLALVVYIRFHAADSFSTYSFQMATSTVFMSCLVHMSALAALPDKFSTDGGRKPRLVAMVVLVALLIPILIISSLPSFYYDASLSLNCAWQQLSSFGGSANTNSGLVATTITLMVCFDYFNRIKQISKSPHGTPTGNTRLPIRELISSFLWRLTSLAFYYTFGLTNLVLTWKSLPPLSQWSLSFGQLLPLALLIFTFLPIYSDFRKDSKMNSDKEIKGSRRGGALSVGGRGDLLGPRSSTDKEGRREDIRTKDSQLDAIGFSSPSSPAFPEAKIPAHMHCEIWQENPQSNSLQVLPKDILPLTAYQTFKVATLFVVAFAFEEFLALLLGGALSAMRASIQLYLLLVLLTLRTSIVWTPRMFRWAWRRLRLVNHGNLEPNV